MPKRCFKPKIKKNTAFKKKFFFMIKYDVTVIFQREISNILQNAVFNSKQSRKTALKKRLFFRSGFDTIGIFQRAMVKIKHNVVFNIQ